MSLPLSTCLFFVSFIQSLRGAQFLNTNSLSLLFGLYCARASIDIVSVASIYASLYSS